MATKFYLIRHGDKEKTPGDPPLSDLGNKQAKLTAQHLQIHPITKIIASPTLRTKQTAHLIANQLSLGIETSDLLKERSNWGDNPKQSFHDFLAMWIKSSRQRDWQPDVGDSSFCSGKRLEKLICNLSQQPDQHIALVTHGGIIADFLRNVFTINELGQFVGNLGFELYDSIKECSITLVEADPTQQQFKLIKFADTSHL